MWRIFVACTLVIMTSLSVEAGQTISPASKLNWMTNYEEAVNKAHTEKKNLLLFFTGSDWCGWCHKLDNEVLSTIDFSDIVSDKFVFVLIDFPLKTALDSKIVAQNKELQKKFNIKGFPTLVLINDQQEQMGSVGYRPGGPKSYAEYLLKMVDDFKNYKKKISTLYKAPLPSSAELQALYGKAQELSRSQDAKKIIKLGMQGQDNHFFLMERFRDLAAKGQIHERKTQVIRQHLLAQDPQNKEKTHYDIAVIEFEAFSEEMEKENYLPEIAAAPLIGYVQQFGENDPENLYRLHMIIAQVFLDKNKIKESLFHAKAAYEAAPDSIKKDIQSFIHLVTAELAV